MCLVQRVVRSVLSARLIFLSPAETQSFSRSAPVPVLLSAERLGFTRTDVGGRSSSSELLGRINAPPAPGLSGRRLTPPPSAADTRLPPRRCAYTTPIRLSGRPKPLKPTRDGPSRGTPPHNSNTTDADASSTGRARCAVCKCPDGRVSLVYGRPGGLRCHRAQWSPRRSGRSLPQRYEIPRASAVWASSHALPPRAAAVQSWA